VRGTAHDLSVEERSRRRWLSETRCMSSARYVTRRRREDKTR